MPPTRGIVFGLRGKWRGRMENFAEDFAEEEGKKKDGEEIFFPVLSTYFIRICYQRSGTFIDPVCFQRVFASLEG